MKNQELTLLYVFDAIMSEASVTRAAERLAMTQPAVSNAIARMRNLWQDPIFVKKGREIQATTFALSLWEQIREPIQNLATALESSTFVPAKSRRKFRIALTDLSVEQYWLPLIQKLSKLAPHVDLYAVPFTQLGAIDQLRKASIDFALGPPGNQDHSLHSSFLFTGYFRLIMGKQHPLAGKAISLNDFLNAKHLVVSRSGNSVGHIDRVLLKQGLQRRVAVTVNHLSVVPKILIASDLIAVVPQRMSETTEFQSQLWITEPPIVVDPAPIYLIWHTRIARDPGAIWLRQLIQETIKQQL